MKVYGVIMAGGGGTRFWPLSREKEPKQLLNISGKDILINETIDRITTIIPSHQIFIVTNEKQVSKMKDVTKKRILSEHILSEPYSRNTAACIGYAAIEIIKKYGDGVMCIFPSDHYIKNEIEFSNILEKAINFAQNEDKLITIGIRPTFPSTGYGYIKYDNAQLNEIKTVLEFKEKPNLATAKKYVDSHEYVWNSGMFVWKASVILNEIKKYLPDLYDDFMKIMSAMNTDEEKNTLDIVYQKIQSISIDYGIMEKSENVMTFIGDFGWSDIGSWDSLDVLYPANQDKNVIVGKHIGVDTYECVVFSKEKLIATVGLSNIIVVETDDAILVCDKKHVQDVKLVVDKLKEQGCKEYI